MNPHGDREHPLADLSDEELARYIVNERLKGMTGHPRDGSADREATDSADSLRQAVYRR